MSFRTATTAALASALIFGVTAAPALAQSSSGGIQERDAQAAAVSAVSVSQRESRMLRVTFVPPTDTTGINEYQVSVFATGSAQPGKTLGYQSVGANRPKTVDVPVRANESASDLPVIVEVRPQSMSAPTAAVRTPFTLVGARAPEVKVRPLSSDGRVVAVTWQDVATNPENEWQTSIVVEVSRDGGAWQPGLDASGSQYGSATERQIDDLQRASRTAVLQLPQNGSYRVRIGIQNSTYVFDGGTSVDEAWATMGSKIKVLAWGVSDPFTTTGAATLSAPAAVKLQAARGGTVTAAWSKAPKASSYRVEVNAGNGWRTMAQTPRKQAVKKVAPKLKKGQRVKVRVQAQHKAAKSRYVQKSTKAR